MASKNSHVVLVLFRNITSSWTDWAGQACCASILSARSLRVLLNISATSYDIITIGGKGVYGASLHAGLYTGGAWMMSYFGLVEIRFA